ncbi:MAG TPA: glycosyltransferase family protein [Brevefilum sp.]|nr:glycosyltransferase family protein [Brevefilum sp.]
MPARDSSVVAIIQARMGSSRLPGKVLKEVCGKPMLVRQVTRVRRASSIGQVVVATTLDPEDNRIAQMCRKFGIPYFRGSPHDVLDRYYRTAGLFRAETIVRLTGDCPVVDPRFIDRTVHSFFETKADFAANRLPPPLKRTTPIGMDTEVVSFDNLARAWCEAEQKHEREHVMPYFYQQEGRFKVVLIDHEPDLSHYRLTVDTPEDLALIQQIYEYFECTDEFSLDEIISLLEQRPDLAALNAGVVQKGFQDKDTRF